MLVEMDVTLIVVILLITKVAGGEVAGSSCVQIALDVVWHRAEASAGAGDGGEGEGGCPAHPSRLD